MKGTECASTFCVDGVCCADPCQGACRSCALPSAMGKCTPVACGRRRPARHLRRPGRRHLRQRREVRRRGRLPQVRPGHARAPASTATSNIYTPASTCNSTGQCVAPSALPCAPFACNGARCFERMHGRRPVRLAQRLRRRARAARSPSARSARPRRSAARASARRACAARPPARARASRARCQARWAPAATSRRARPIRRTPAWRRRRRRAARTACAPRALPEVRAGHALRRPELPREHDDLHARLDVRRRGRVRDARGELVLPVPLRRLGLQGELRRRRRLRAARVCTNGSCGLKSPGRDLRRRRRVRERLLRAERLLQDGLHGEVPVVRARGDGGDLHARPRAAARTRRHLHRTRAPATCDTTGFCDGKGALRALRRGHALRAADLPRQASTQTLGRACDGAGMCKPASTQSCAPYMCNGTICDTTCLGDGDCAAPAICDLAKNKCGDKHRLGEACTVDDDCLSVDACVDGVCCATPSCGTCQACNVMGHEGTCAEVPADAADPHGRCAASPPCGFVRHCDGAGACRERLDDDVVRDWRRARTRCSRRVGFCNGSGTCKQTPVGCSGYMCGAGAACLTTCGGDGDCASGYSCANGSCTNLTTNGGACTDGDHVHQRPLRRAGLLRRLELPGLLLLRRLGQSRQLPARAQGRRRSPRDLHGDGGRHLRHRRHLRRQRRVRLHRRGHGVRGRGDVRRRRPRC